MSLSHCETGPRSLPSISKPIPLPQAFFSGYSQNLRRCMLPLFFFSPRRCTPPFFPCQETDSPDCWSINLFTLPTDGRGRDASFFSLLFPLLLLEADPPYPADAGGKTPLCSSLNIRSLLYHFPKGTRFSLFLRKGLPHEVTFHFSFPIDRSASFLPRARRSSSALFFPLFSQRGEIARSFFSSLLKALSSGFFPFFPPIQEGRA